MDELLAQKSMWEEDRATYERAAASHRDQIAVWEEKWEEEQEKVAALETRLVTTTNQVRAMEIDAARARAAAEALQARCDELMNIEVEVQRVRAEASEARAAAAARGSGEGGGAGAGDRSGGAISGGGVPVGGLASRAGDRTGGDGGHAG